MARNQRDENHLDVSGRTVENSTGVITISVGSAAWAAIAPAGVTVSTISKWFKVHVEGTEYYIPMWT